jgi:DNA polymerase-3 subunit delta'
VKPFDSILGHERPLQALNGLLENDRLPHAMLFHGFEGVGKATVAQRLAGALLCHDKGCETCEDCRLFKAGNHPDFVLVTFELRKDKKEYRKQIVVDQIRALSNLVGLGPRKGARRVFLIDPADRMNTEAQNALLKTLEEPPPRAVLILIASRPQILLSTVRSRCFALGFGPLRAEHLASLLASQGIDRREALQRAALAEGRPGRALDLEIEALRERRETVLAGLERLASQRDTGTVLKLGAALAGKDGPALETNLELLLTLLRDAGRAAMDDATAVLVHADLAERLTRLGRALGAERSAALVTSVDRLRDQLRFNLNRTLVAESLLAAVAGGPLP